MTTSRFIARPAVLVTVACAVSLAGCSGAPSPHRLKLAPAATSIQVGDNAKMLAHSLEKLLPGVTDWATDRAQSEESCDLTDVRTSPKYVRVGTTRLSAQQVMDAVETHGRDFGLYGGPMSSTPAHAPLQVEDNRPDGYVVDVLAWSDHRVEISVIGPCVVDNGWLPPAD